MAPPKVTLRIDIDPGLQESLDRECQRLDRTRSDCVRQAIIEWLNRQAEERDG